MSSPLPTLYSVVRLSERARLYGASLLGPSFHQGFPIPVGDRERTLLEFFYCHGEVVQRHTGFQIWPPKYVATVDPATGKLERIRAMTPADLDQSDSPVAPLGRCLAPPERMTDVHLTLLAQFYQAYDDLLPWYASPARMSSDEIGREIQAFKQHFAGVAEPPLLPYYRAVGQHFFDWLDRSS